MGVLFLYSALHLEMIRVRAATTMRQQRYKANDDGNANYRCGLQPKTIARASQFQQGKRIALMR